MSYSKIKLRTKTSAAVQVADLDARELAYGAGGSEDSIFVKNPTGTLRRFMYVDDAATATGATWSSTKIASMISAVTGDHTTITDWEAAFTTGFNSRFSAKTTDGLAEGVSNLYYTNARARAAMSVTDTNSVDLTYSSVSGNFSADVKVDTSIMEVTAAGVRVKNAGII